MESECHCVAARLKVTRLSEVPAELEACICALEFVRCIWLCVSVLVQGLQCHFVTSGWMSNVYTLCYALVCMSNVLKETYRHVGICWRGWDVCKLERTCKKCCVHIEIKVKCEAWSIRSSIHSNSGISWQARFLRQHCIHALTAFAVCGWQTSGSDWIMASYIPPPPYFFSFFSGISACTFLTMIHSDFLMTKRSAFVRLAFLKEMEAPPQLVLALHFFFLCSCDVHSLYLFQPKQLWKCACVCDSVSHFSSCIALSLSLSFHLCEVTPPLTCM